MYFITLLTFFNLGSSAYFYAKTIKKRGQKGPRGLQGNVGERGDSGYCELTCKENSIKHMIINEIKKTNLITNNNNVENKICRFFSNIIDDEREKINNLTFDNYNNIVTNFGNSLALSSENGNLNDILGALNSDGSINDDANTYPKIEKNTNGEYTLVSTSASVSVSIILKYNLSGIAASDQNKIITLNYSEDPCA